MNDNLITCLHCLLSRFGLFLDRKALCTAIVIVLNSCLFALTVKAQRIVYSDDYSTPASSSYTTTNGLLPSGGNLWSVYRSGGDFGARVNDGKLNLTNDATGASNVNGSVFVYDYGSSVAPPYNPILGLNQGNIEWRFNMQQSQTEPTGFFSGAPYGTGVAYILACNSSDPENSGEGYALIHGKASTFDELDIVRFSGGLQSDYTVVTTVHSSCNGGCISELGNQNIEIVVSFSPSTGGWKFSSTLTDGTISNAGSGVDNTYTNLALPYFGFYWHAAGGTTKQAFSSYFETYLVPELPNTALLSYNQGFGSTGFQVYPTAFKGWAGLSGTYTTNQSQAESSAPSINCPLTAKNGTFSSAPAGGLYGYATASNGKIAIATSPDDIQGVNQPIVGVIADNTVSQFTVEYDLDVLYAGTKPTGNEVMFQTTDNGFVATPWAPLPNSVNNYNSPTAGEKRTCTYLIQKDPTKTLNYYFRWVSWRNNLIGSTSTTLGLDNVKFTAVASSAAVNISTPPLSSLSHPAGTANVILQQINLQQTAAATAASINSLTINTSGTFLPTDILNLKVRYSADATLTGADPTLASVFTSLGPGVHVMSPFTPQILPAGATGYLFITADLSATAVGENYIQLSDLSFDNIGITGGIKLGINPIVSTAQSFINRPVIESPPSTLSLTPTTANLRGNTLSDGGSLLTKRGFYYSLTSGFADGAGTEVSVSGTFGVGPFSQTASGLTANTTYYFKSFAVNPYGTVYSSEGSFTTPKLEPTNPPTAFACGTTGLTSIPLTWTDATGSVVPDGYLISWSTTSYASIPNPNDGAPIGDNSYNLNVAPGVQSATISNLSYNQTYYFKIFSYTNSGTNINYRTATFGQTSCATQSGQTETFEIGTKGAYATANATCVLGSWNMNEALIGNTASDVKNGSQSVRMRNAGGYLTMNFDLSNGVSTVSVKHAKYGTDANSNWQLEYSLNGGSTWIVQGSVVTTSGTTLATQSYTVNQPGSIRFRIAKVTNNNRLNIDDILFVPFCSAPSPTSSISFSNITSSGLNSTWSNGVSPGTMLVIKPTATTNKFPTFGTVYTPNLNWDDAEQLDVNNRVMFRASGSTATGITGLAAETQYTATAYNYSASNCYQRDGAATGNFWTLSTVPSAHASSFSVITSSDTKSYLSFSAASTIANADGYLLVQKEGSAPVSLPITGTAYSPGASLGDAQVVDLITSPSATDYTVSGLTAGTLYYFGLIPFNWNGSNPETFNYRTNATIPMVNTTTSFVESVQSDVITDPTFTYSSNIDFVAYQGVTANTVAGTVAVYKILIRDGGGVDDADLYPTIPEILTIHFNTKNAIRAAGLFGGASQNTYISSAVVGSNSILFTGLSSAGALVTADDGQSIELTIRVTFKTVIADNTQLQFSVNGTADAVAYPGASSQFYDFPSEKSGMVGDNNRIEVIATKIKFDFQPDDRDAGVALAPFAIVAVDAFNNIDLDNNSSSVTLTKAAGSGTMTAPGSPYTFVNGYVVVGDVSFNTITTGAKILATASPGLGSSIATSEAFDITGIVYVTGDYRSNGTAWGTLAHWQTRSGFGTWVAALALPSSGSRVYINTAMSTSLSSSVSQIIVLSGATLSVQVGGAGSMATTDLVVKTGGSLFLAKTVAVTGNFRVEDGGTVTVNFAATNQSTLWDGTEYFFGNSNFIIKNWGVSASPSSSRILYTNQISAKKRSIFFAKAGPSAPFGNLTIDLTTNLGNTLYLTNGSSGFGLTNGTLTVKSTDPTQRISFFGASSSGYSAVGRNLEVDAAYSSSGTFQISGSGSNNLEVFGSMNLNAGNTVLKSSTGTGVDTISVYGNLNVGASTNLLFNESASTSAKVNLKLEGDLTVNATGNLGNFSATSGVGNYELQFSGIGEGTTSANTQEISIASASTTLENVNIKFQALSGSYVQLINQNFELGQNSQLIVAGGATFHFGFNGFPGLLVGISGSSTNTSFTSEGSSILKITESQGIWTSGSPYGNVRTANRTYGPGGTFWYLGKSFTQGVGNGLPAGNAAKTIICDLTSSNPILYTISALQFPMRSGIEIRNGIFSETSSGAVSGEGYLTMAAGTTYRCSRLGSVFPNLTDFDRFSISQGTFEMTGTGGTQTLNNLPTSIHSLKVSGSGTKSLSESIVVDNSLEISGGTLDIGSNRISGNGTLVMTGGTFKMGPSTASLYPELAGLLVPYSLAGGTIELYGTTSSGPSQTLRTTTAGLQPITYNNLTINAAEGNFNTHNVGTQASLQLAGTMDINYPSVFYLANSNIVSGTGSFNLNNKACLKFEEANGLTSAACGTGASCGQIRTTNRTFSPDGRYWISGNQAGMVTGSGMPSTVHTLMVNRSGTNAVALSNDLTVKYFLGVQNTGMLETGLKKITISDTATVVEEEMAHVVGKLETTRTLGLTNQTFGGMGIEIDADGASPGPTLVTRETGTTVPGTGSQAINRSFSIHPTVNTGLNATLVFKYFEDELNSLNENNLSLYRSTDAGVTWLTQGGTVDLDLNTLSKTGINAFSDWTIGDFNSPLPVSLLSFQGKVVKDQAHLKWQAIHSKEVMGFHVLRSSDGQNFKSIGYVPASQISTEINLYSFTDVSFDKSYYYMLQFDELQPSVKTSQIIHLLHPELGLPEIYLSPNPTEGHFSLTANQELESDETLQAQLLTIDGRIIVQQEADLQVLNSILENRLISCKPGIYILTIQNQRINKRFRISRN